MAMTADDFVGELHQYIHEQEKAPLYGRSFFDGVMAGKVDRGALKEMGHPRRNTDFPVQEINMVNTVRKADCFPLVLSLWERLK